MKKKSRLIEVNAFKILTEHNGIYIVPVKKWFFVLLLIIGFKRNHEMVKTIPGSLKAPKWFLEARIRNERVRNENKNRKMGI